MEFLLNEWKESNAAGLVEIAWILSLRANGCMSKIWVGSLLHGAAAISTVR